MDTTLRELFPDFTVVERLDTSPEVLDHAGIMSGPWTAASWIRATDVRSSSDLLADTSSGVRTAVKLEQYKATAKVGFTQLGVADHWPHTPPRSTTGAPGDGLGRRRHRGLRVRYAGLDRAGRATLGLAQLGRLTETPAKSTKGPERSGGGPGGFWAPRG